MDFLDATRAIAAAFALGAIPAHAQGLPDAQSLGRMLTERLQAEPHTTCLGAAVVEQSMRAVAACHGEGARVEAGAIFEIGTLSRVFAGLLLADMVERGELSLDDPVAMHSLPGAKVPARPGPAITLRHLVTHTAALPDLPEGFKPREFLARVATGDPAALYEALAQVELTRPVGGDAEPSQLGYLWLADILGRRGGERYDRLVTRRILEPLGMRDTFVVPTPEQAKRRAPSHDRRYNVLPPFEFPPALAGPTGWSASLEDLAKLAAALAGRTRGPLDNAIARSLEPLQGVSRGAWVGYAWLITQRPAGRIAFMNGQAPGSYAALAVDRAARRASVVVADAPAFYDDLAMHLVDAQAPLKRVSPDALPMPPDRVRVP